MISINKYLVITVIASVLLSAAMVRADARQPSDEQTTNKTGHAGLLGMVGNIKDRIMSFVSPHIPFIGGQKVAPVPAQVEAPEKAAAKAVEETARDGKKVMDETEQVANEAEETVSGQVENAASETMTNEKEAQRNAPEEAHTTTAASAEN